MGYRHIKSFDMEESVITDRIDYFENLTEKSVHSKKYLVQKKTSFLIRTLTYSQCKRLLCNCLVLIIKFGRTIVRHY